MKLLEKLFNENTIITQNDYVLINEVKICGVYSMELEYPKVILYDCNNYPIADVFIHDITHLEIVGEND